MTGRPAGTTRRVRASGGVGLAVDVLVPDDAPSGAGFLLVHGLASNARLYDGVARRLAAAGHATAAVDLRGHGRSDKPEAGYDYGTMCADLAAVLADLTADPGEEYFGRPIVVGQSFGGNLVLELAFRRPDILRGVACIDGGTIDLAEQFETFAAVAERLSPPRLAGTPVEALRTRIRAAHPGWSAEAVSATLANFEQRSDGTVAPLLSLEHHLAILETMWSHRPGELYADISVPVLLLPAVTPGTPPEWAEAKRAGVATALAQLRTAEVHWFDPADHDVHAERPDEVAEVLLERAGTLFA